MTEETKAVKEHENIQREPETNTSQEHSAETVTPVVESKETPTEVVKEEPKKEGKEEPKEEVKEPVKETPKESVKETPKETFDLATANVDTLKKRLNELNEQKEVWFQKKEELNKEIAVLIKSLKALNPEIEIQKVKERELRQQRDVHNKQFLSSLSQSKNLVKNQRALTEKYGQGMSPTKLEERIQKLEYSIETEALSMTKEKKIMEKIRELKKVLGAVETVGDFKAQMGEISKSLTEAKEQADVQHTALKEHVKENKRRFREYLANSKKVNQLKKEQRKAFKQFVTFKTEFAKVNSALKEQMKKEGIAPPKRKKNKKQPRKEVHKVKTSFIDTAKIIEEKVKVVEEKLRSKKKLTTEDILAMQGKKE